MASHKSAEKRIGQTKKRNAKNTSIRSKIGNVSRAVKGAAASGKKDEALKALQHAQSEIMKAVSKGVLHKRTAARKVSSLTLKLKEAKA